MTVRDELLEYYERELTYLRQLGAEFSEKYPKVASRLLIDPNRCEDPHVERLIESFAFLAARVHLKIDDEFPEITEALLSVLYPHYIRPIPSSTIVQFHLDREQGKLTAGLPIPRGSTLYSQPVDGYPCKFKTCFDATLWPLGIAAAQWVTPDRLRPAIKSQDAVAALRLEIECFPEVTFDKLELRSLRFYLNGESSLIHTLYELLCNNCTQILLRDRAPNTRKHAISLPGTQLQPDGFSDAQALLPYPRRSFSGYRILQEYFHFPEKFFFVELHGLETFAPQVLVRAWRSSFSFRASNAASASRPWSSTFPKILSGWVVRPRSIFSLIPPSRFGSIRRTPSTSSLPMCGAGVPWRFSPSKKSSPQIRKRTKC
jgi:type VI secretion system protein ImpG